MEMDFYNSPPRHNRIHYLSDCRQYGDRKPDFHECDVYHIDFSTLHWRFCLVGGYEVGVRAQMLRCCSSAVY